jgi:cytochrome b561
MQPVSPTATRYDRATMAFHWATVLLVLGNWLGAQTIDWFPRGPLRVDARSVHITVGVLLTLLLVGRVVWRATQGRRLPLADRGPLNILAKGTHWLLYGLLFAMVGLGLGLTWSRGDSIFNLFALPALDPANKALPHQLEGLHNTVGYAILALAGIHAAAALVHRFLWHDGVLARMLPGRP